jgi:predicted Zn-dependent peptidase
MRPNFSVAIPAVAALVWYMPSAGAQELAIEKYTLSNGMTVILHPDRTVPRVAVNTWFRVGSRNEPSGRSGFAHLFEHLMFMGTRRVPGNDFDVVMETGGGANNASTSLDRTNYFSWGPSSLLPTLLWLDADRLEHLGQYMTQEKLDKQRDIVRNERRQVIEEAPYARAYESSVALLFPAGHPYHTGVMGTHADLEAATVTDVQNFFATFYAPNNASLVVAGDFDPKAVKPMIEAYFGTLPRGNVAPQAVTPAPRLDRVLRETTLDRVQLPKVAFSYHSPAQFAEGDAEMDLVAAILASGNASRLYQRLVVKDELAAGVTSFQDSSAMGSIFRVEVMAMPGADLSRVEAIIDEELNTLTSFGPGAEELERRKSQAELALLSAMESIESRADRLNQYEYFFGEPNSLERDLKRYRTATVESVKRWCAKVLTPSARLVQRVLPLEPMESASPRDTRPTDPAQAPFTAPTPDTFELANGARVMVFSKPGLPLLSCGVFFSSGGPTDAPEQAGRAALLAEMLDEGTQALTSEQFSQALQGAGATFDAGASQESLAVSMTVLKRSAGVGLGLLADAISKPRLAPEDFARVQRLHLEDLKQRDEEPRLLARKVALLALLGKSNPYGVSSAGTVETAGAVAIGDVVAASKSLLRPEHATIVLAGDITANEARQLLQDRFGNWTGSPDPGRAASADFGVPKSGGMRLLVVDRPGAVQTVIALAAPSAPVASEDRVELAMLNTILGGSFSSRLNQNLREKNNFTYGASTRFALAPSLGVFSAGSAVKADVTGAALREFLGELRRIRTGDVTPEETTKAAKSVRDEFVSSLGSRSGVVGAAGQAFTDRLGWASVGEDLAAIDAITARDLNALASGAIRLEEAVIVLVGDRGVIVEQLAKHASELGLPEAQFVDEHARPAATAKAE